MSAAGVQWWLRNGGKQSRISLLSLYILKCIWENDIMVALKAMLLISHLLFGLYTCCSERLKYDTICMSWRLSYLLMDLRIHSYGENGMHVYLIQRLQEYSTCTIESVLRRLSHHWPWCRCSCSCPWSSPNSVCMHSNINVITPVLERIQLWLCKVMNDKWCMKKWRASSSSRLLQFESSLQLQCVTAVCVYILLWNRCKMRKWHGNNLNCPWYCDSCSRECCCNCNSTKRRALQHNYLLQRKGEGNGDPINSWGLRVLESWTW